MNIQAIKMILMSEHGIATRKWSDDQIRTQAKTLGIIGGGDPEPETPVTGEIEIELEPEPEPTAPKCRRCGGTMKRKTAKKGRREGQDFWGCIHFPDCRGTVNIDESTEPKKTPKKQQPKKEQQPMDNTKAAALELLLSGGISKDDVLAIVKEQLIDFEAAPLGIELTVNKEAVQVSEEYHHKQFKQVLTSLLTREPVYLYGVASGGKTTMYKQLAASLTAMHKTDIPLITSVQLFTQFEITGYKDASGKMVSTIFRQWFEGGGLLAIDEFDRSLAKALTALNQMIENRFFTFPDSTAPQQMHENCYFIASGNTPLNGNGSGTYNAAEAIDGATRDRFIAIEFEFDKHIEKMMAASNDVWLDQVRRIRAAVAELGISIVVSTRPIRQGAKLLAQGMSLKDVVNMTIFKGLDSEQAVKILHCAKVEV